MIKTDLSFTLKNTNFGLPTQLFHHYEFLFLEITDTPLQNPVRETLLYRITEGLTLNYHGMVRLKIVSTVNTDYIQSSGM
jgi:hypothetical protein